VIIGYLKSRVTYCLTPRRKYLP